MNINLLKDQIEAATTANYLPERERAYLAAGLNPSVYTRKKFYKKGSTPLNDYLARMNSRYVSLIDQVQSVALADIKRFPEYSSGTFEFYLQALNNVCNTLKSTGVIHQFETDLITATGLECLRRMKELSNENGSSKPSFIGDLWAFRALKKLVHWERIRQRLDGYVDFDEIAPFKIDIIHRAGMLIAAARPLPGPDRVPRQIISQISYMATMYSSAASWAESEKMTSQWKKLQSDAHHLNFPTPENPEQLAERLGPLDIFITKNAFQFSFDLYMQALELMMGRENSMQPLTDDDARQIISLYMKSDPERSDFIWSQVLADLYESNNTSFFDPVRSTSIRVARALAPRGEVAALHLGWRHQYPLPNNLRDKPRAAYWYARALSDKDNAQTALVRSISLISATNELTELKKYIPQLMSLLKYDLNNNCEEEADTGLLLAHAYATGKYGRPLDQSKADAYYHAVAVTDVSNAEYRVRISLQSRKRIAAMAAACRHLLGIASSSPQSGKRTYANIIRSSLGLNLTTSFKEARKYASIVLANSNPNDLTDATERSDAIRILELTKETTGEELTQIQNLFRDILGKTATPADVLKKLELGILKSSSLLEGYFWIFDTYIESEGMDYPSFFECRKAIQMKLLGHTEVKRVQSVFKYNLETATGSPILGAIARPPHENIKAGFGKFRGLSVDPRGELDLSFDPVSTATGLQPLVTPQDIAVALALAFAEGKPVWPSLSAEPAKKRTPTDPKWMFYKPVWGPAWLGHTDLGNTLFATDCEAGPLVTWLPEDISLPGNIGGPPSIEKLKAIVNKMVQAGSSNLGATSFLTFKVAAVELTWSSTASAPFVCTSKKTTIAISTGNSDEHDNRMYTNNKDQAQGYRAAIFNENFDLFAEHYPLLERYRQLATLVTALNELRERGFTPKASLKTSIDETYRQFVNRPAPVHASQLFF